MDSDLADWQEKFKSQVFSVCSALGGFEQIALAGRSPVKATTLPAPTDATSGALQYVLGDECLDCLKDLKRYIRQDETNPAKHVLGWLGEWSILQRDLLPLLEVTAARLLADNATHTDVLTQRYSHRMAAVCISALELLVVMTWYVDKDERGEAPWFDRVLCGYKLAFATHPTVIAILLQLLVQALAIPAGHRSARDRIIVNGVLLIYRNLLEIPDPHVSITASGELITHGKLQEMLIETFHRKDIYDLMLTFASSADERELLPYNLIIHDILYFSFKDVHPEELFRDASQHAMRITDRLMTEKRQAKLDRPQASISRHSRFGGTYAVQSPTGQVMTMLTSQTFTQPLDHTMDDKKTKSKRVKAPKAEAYEKLRHPFQDHQTFTILARVAKTYLESGFNTLAASVREDIERERAKVKAQDATRFMYTTAFFMQTLLLLVNHQEGVTPHLTLIERPFATTMAPSEPTLDTYGFELIGSMVSLPAFALVVRNLRTFYEEKRWAEMHTGVRCFLQLLRTLIRMSNSAAEAHREVADHMFQNLCYEAATLDLLGTLVRQGDNHTFDQSYLTDLVELMHLFLRVLEHYAQEKQHMFVRKKQRVPRSAKPSNDDPALNGAQHAEADASDAAASADDDSARYTFVEREFELTQCERDLARESVINTYSTLLKQYRELPSMAVYWIVTMFQRLAIKQGFEGLFFKLSTLELFHNILTDQRRLKVYAQVDQELSTNAGLVPWDLGASNNATTLRQVSPWTALCEFIEHIVKQFFARLSTEPMLFMEVLFSHTRLECLRPDLQQVIKPKSSRRPATAAVASSSEEASHDFDNFVATCRFDFAVLRRHEEEHGHIAVPPHFPWSHKLGAVIGILLYRQLGAAVQWVKQALAEAKAQRNQHISEESNEPASSAPLATIPDYVLARSSEHYGALQHHPQLAELLRLVGFHYVPSIESSDQPDDGVSMGSWVLITAVPIADLDLNIQTIDEYVISPLGPDGTPLPRTAPSKSKKKAPRHIRRHPVSPCSGSDNENDSLQVHTKRLPRQRKGKPKRKPSSKAQPMHTSDGGVPVSNAAEPLGGTGSSQALGFNDQPKKSASLARKVSALALSTSPDTSEVEAALESSDDPSSSGGDSNAQFMRPSLPVRPKPLVSREPMSSPSADRPTLSPPTKRIRRLKNRHFQENDTVWPSSPPDALQPDQDALLVHSRSVSGVDYSPHKAERVSTGGVAVSHSQLAPSDEQNSETDLDEAIDGLDTGAAPTISIARTRNVYQSRRRTMGIVSDSE